jgi:hypothetical protein
MGKMGKTAAAAAAWWKKKQTSHQLDGSFQSQITKKKRRVNMNERACNVRASEKITRIHSWMFLQSWFFFELGKKLYKNYRM